MRNRDKNKAQTINKNTFQSASTAGMMLGSGGKGAVVSLGKEKKLKKKEKNEEKEE